jgi:hypothetical protein
MKRISLLVLFFLCGLQPTFAQDNGLNETFEDSDLPGWELSQASVQEGILRVNAEDGYAQVMGEWSDFALTVRVRPPSTGSLSIHYWVSEVGAYFLQFNNNNDQPYLSLNRQVGGNSLMMNGTAIAVPPDWWQIDIHVANNVHEVQVNGEFKLLAIDPEPLPAGSIQLGGSGSGFDDLAIAVGDAIPPLSPVGQQVTEMLTSAVSPTLEENVLTATLADLRQEATYPERYENLRLNISTTRPGAIHYEQELMGMAVMGASSYMAIDRYAFPYAAQQAFDQITEQRNITGCELFYDFPACWGRSTWLDTGEHYHDQRWIVWLYADHIFTVYEDYVGVFKSDALDPMSTAEKLFENAVAQGVLSAPALDRHLDMNIFWDKPIQPPQSTYAITLGMNDAEAAYADWVLGSVTGEIATGQLNQGESNTVELEVNWSAHPAIHWNELFYVFGQGDDGSTFAEIVAVEFDNFSSTILPTATASCGYASFVITTGTELNLAFPDSTFKMEVANQGIFECGTLDWQLIGNPLQPDVLSCSPARGVLEGSQEPSQSTLMEIECSIDWSQIGSGQVRDYFLVLFSYPRVNGTVSAHLIQIHAAKMGSTTN